MWTTTKRTEEPHGKELGCMKPFCVRPAICDLRSANSDSESRYMPVRWGSAHSSSFMWNSRLRSGGSPAGRSLGKTSVYSACSSWTLGEFSSSSKSIDLMSMCFPASSPCKNKAKTGVRCLRSRARRCRLMVFLGSRMALIVMDWCLCLMVILLFCSRCARPCPRASACQ